MVATKLSELSVPNLHWSVVRDRLNSSWTAREAPHISVMAQTRAGKTYLATRGILPLCQMDRVCFVDVKGSDPTSSSWGKAVRQLPRPGLRSLRSLFRGSEPREHWYRLVTHSHPSNTEKARDQVRRAFDQILAEGDWVIVFDELRAITDPASPGLHLKPYYEEFILRGGSKGIATVSLSQEPRWCPGAFYTQSNFYFFSRLEDEATHKRIAEVGSTKQIIPHIQKVRRHHWLYMDNIDEDRFWAHTKVTSERG